MAEEPSPSPEERAVESPQGAAEATPIAEDIESLNKALAAEKAKAESYLANWQRSQADYINFKRRTEQEKAEAARFANSILILNLLPVLDDLQRAFASLSATMASFTWVNGIQLIYRKLETILEAQGLSQIKALGEKFDPRQHEAVLYGEGEEGAVIEELQRGYKLYDRVIRPTLVVVGKGKEATPEEGREKPTQETP